MKNLNFSQIIENLIKNQIIKNETELSSLLGISKQNLFGYKKRDKIPYESLTVFCGKNQISIDWLLTGKGEMLRGTAPVVEDKQLQVMQTVAQANVCENCGQEYGLKELIQAKDTIISDKNELLRMKEDKITQQKEEITELNKEIKGLEEETGRLEKLKKTNAS